MMHLGIDYDSHTILSRIKTELEDETRWQIEPYWVGPIKQVKIIWHCSQLIYNFFKIKQSEINESGSSHEYDQLFQLKKRHKSDDPESYKQTITILFDDLNRAIIIDWAPGTHQLTNSQVNQSIEGLTAQHICLYVKIPFYNGLCLKTGFSQYWQHRRRDYTHSVFPYYHQFKINCYISSHRGIYARADAANENQRIVQPIKCITTHFCPYYTNWHNGRRVITINNQHVYYRHRIWKSAGPRLPLGSTYRAIMHADGYMYHKHSGLPLIDLTTGLQVRGTDYIKPGFAYRYVEQVD